MKSSVQVSVEEGKATQLQVSEYVTHTNYFTKATPQALNIFCLLYQFDMFGACIMCILHVVLYAHYEQCKKSETMRSH